MQPKINRLVLWWARLYTVGLPRRERASRIEEIESDVWEQREFDLDAGASATASAARIVARLLRGAPMDISWRMSQRGVERDALAIASDSARSAGRRGLRSVLGYRLGVGVASAVTLFALAAGSWTAIQDQSSVGDRVDTEFIGISLTRVEHASQYSALPRVDLVDIVPEMAVKARTRRGDTTTKLNDGRVLVVGSLPVPGDWNGAQIYNPQGKAWQSTAYLADKRRWHSVVLLQDGRALATGGRERSGRLLRTAEVFNPDNDSWTSTGAMEVGRALHASALLRDGRVLVVGGFDDRLQTLATAELYNPRTGTWSPVADMREARSLPSATTLQDGRILVVGGSHTGPGLTAFHASAEIFDPATGLWSAAGALTHHRAGHTATTLRDGRAIVVGGGGPVATIAQAEIYDPATGEWTLAGELNVSRTGHSASLMDDGRVIVAGGWSGESGSGHIVELFDPRVGTWLTLAASP